MRHALTCMAFSVLPDVHAAFITPPWNYTFANASRACIDATTATAGLVPNRRFIYWALPPGPAPPTGWPVFVSLGTAPYHQPGDERSCKNGGLMWGRATVISHVQPLLALPLSLVPPAPRSRCSQWYCRPQASCTPACRTARSSTCRPGPGLPSGSSWHARSLAVSATAHCHCATATAPLPLRHCHCSCHVVSCRKSPPIL